MHNVAGKIVLPHKFQWGFQDEVPVNTILGTVYFQLWIMNMHFLVKFDDMADLIDLLWEWKMCNKNQIFVSRSLFSARYIKIIK